MHLDGEFVMLVLPLEGGGGRPNSCYNNMMEKVVELTINMVECVVVFM